MDGYVFFEVDNMGNPIYGDKMKELLNCEKEHILFILSAEYQANFSVELIDHKVIIIPEDVLKKIDIAIENKEDRETYMSISPVKEFEEWLDSQITKNRIDVLTTIEHYVSVARVCKKKHTFMTYMYGSRPRNNNGVVAQEIDNNSLQIQIQQQSTMIQELKNEIQDKKVYIDSILAHATNLDNELKKYRNWYEQSPRYGERVEELEKINEKCTQLDRFTYFTNDIYYDGICPECGEKADHYSYTEFGTNEKGVSVSATETLYGNEKVTEADPYRDAEWAEANKSERTGIEETDIPTIILAEASSAREGVKLLLDIYENYGCVAASGVFVCDKDEVWYVENCSGTQYVAIKLNNNMIFLEPNMAVIGRVDLDDENVIASKDLIAVAKKAGTFVGDEAKNIIDFRASYARISEKMDQRMIDGLNYLNATYKYDSDALVADNTKFTISNLDASDKLVALYTNIKADRKLDKDDVFGYYKLSSIGKASNQEIEIFQLFKDRPVETATVGWVGVGNMSYNVFVPYYPMLIDGMYKGYQVSTASAAFTTEKPDTFCTYGTSWAQDAEGNWQRVSGFKAYPSNWKDSYYFTFEGLGGYIANADKITGKPLKAEAKAYVADQLAALQQELYKDFVTTDQLAKADDARALATENGKTMAEKAHKLGVELVEYITKDEALQPSVFTDVKEGAYYVDAVNWAVDKKVTSGKTETTFAPNDSCTRAQAVTFLWRAAGSPEPTASEMTFTDVKADAYYYKAVLWAVENKITSGMSDTLFAPDATCSRSQIVTFLYRMQNSPKSKAKNPFTDVKADAYYANAVLWAVENGVTTGASATTFDPAGDCTRGQIVTFLYRCLSK